MYDIPIIITDKNGKILLKNKSASEKIKKISYGSCLEVIIANGSGEKVSSLGEGEYTTVPLRRMGKLKCALVCKNVCYGAEFFTYAFFGKAVSLDELSSDPKLYMTGLEINNIRAETSKIFGIGFEFRTFSELMDELAENASKLELFSSKIDVIYENRSFLHLERMQVPSVLLSALFVLLGVCDGISSDKRIVISADYFDDVLALCIKTAVRSDSGTFCRAIDIFDAGIAGGELHESLALCAMLFGADDKKISVSFDGASGENVASFEYRIKKYEKRPAGIKTDVGYSE